MFNVLLQIWLVLGKWMATNMFKQWLQNNKKKNLASVDRTPKAIKFREAVTLARYSNDPIYKLIASELVDHGHINFWKNKVYGEGIRVAILDTGLDKINPFFRDCKNIIGKSFITDEDGTVKPENDWYIDKQGHGTFVASQIYCKFDLAEVVRGNQIVTCSCPKLDKLIIGKVLDNTGHGQWKWIISAFDWLLSMQDHERPHFVNCSLSGNPLTKETDEGKAIIERIKKLKEKGTLVFAAAGNTGLKEDPSVQFFANTDEAYAISALDNTIQYASFSSYGKEVDYSMDGSFRVGVSIKTGLTYAKLNGTSMATPDAVGFAALSLSHLCKGDSIRAYEFNKNQIPYIEVLWRAKNMIFDPPTSPAGRDEHFGIGVLWFRDGNSL